jgi:hypothetical protein
MLNRACWILVALLLPLLAKAHGLLLDADSDGSSIFGSAYYSNGEKAANESISLFDLSTPDSAPIRATTDAEGNFRFAAVASNRYRVAIYGDEGHSVEVELVASVDTNPMLVDADAGSKSQLWPPPAWAVIGGILVLSLVPVVAMRKRQRG